MMKKTRPKTDAALRAKIAVETLREQSTIADLAQTVPDPPQPNAWKKQLIEQASRALRPSASLGASVHAVRARGEDHYSVALLPLAFGGRLAAGRPLELHMTHTVRKKAKLLARVRRIRGQVEAVERALEAEIGCADVLQLIASIRGAVNGLTAELVEDHIRLHIVDPSREPDSDRARGAEELIDVVRTYLK